MGSACIINHPQPNLEVAECE